MLFERHIPIKLSLGKLLESFYTFFFRVSEDLWLQLGRREGGKL